MVPPFLVGIFVTLTEGKRRHLLCRAGYRAGGSGKFALVHIIHRHRLTKHGHRLGARIPVKIRIGQQLIITGERGEIMPIGVTVALREHALSIGRIDHTIGSTAAGLLLDVVIHGVDRLTGIDAAGVVPIQAIVAGSHIHGRGEVIAAAQEGQLLLQRRGDLAFESEAAGVHQARVILVIYRDRWVDRVGVGLVAENGVKVVEISCSQQQCLIGVRIIGVGINAHAAGTIEHSFVDGDEANIIDIVERQSDIAFPARARLGQHADIRAHTVVIQVGDPLIEGVDRGQHTFDPALYQLRRHPARPIGAGDIVGAGLGAVAQGKPPVIEDELRTAEGIHARSTDNGKIIVLSRRITRGLPGRPRRDVVGLHCRIDSEV